MSKSTRIALIVAALAAAVGAVAFLAWWDSVHPLRYLSADRVITAGVGTLGARGRVGRDLSPAEIAELCRRLAAARSTGPVDTPGAVRVELMTRDLGRVEVEDLSGPGARAAIFAGTPDEKRFTLSSSELGDLLERLRKSLATDGHR